jgi:hypothetical protein
MDRVMGVEPTNPQQCRIAEVVKKANLIGRRESTTPPLILLLPLFVVVIILSKKGFCLLWLSLQFSN